MPKFKEMTDAQKQEAFQKYLEGRENRGQYSEARRKAGTRLQKAHADEFNKYLAEEKALQTSSKPGVKKGNR